jgi:hypothetical protein
VPQSLCPLVLKGAFWELEVAAKLTCRCTNQLRLQLTDKLSRGSAVGDSQLQLRCWMLVHPAVVGAPSGIALLHMWGTPGLKRVHGICGGGVWVLDDPCQAHAVAFVRDQLVTARLALFTFLNAGQHVCV